jgi:hypothetical protein
MTVLQLLECLNLIRAGFRQTIYHYWRFGYFCQGKVYSIFSELGLTHQNQRNRVFSETFRYRAFLGKNPVSNHPCVSPMLFIYGMFRLQNYLQLMQFTGWLFPR